MNYNKSSLFQEKKNRIALLRFCHEIKKTFLYRWLIKLRDWLENLFK